MTHDHAHTEDFSQHFTAEFWDARYATGSIWSGNPNPVLVEKVESLTPGTALEVGSGEGADAIWLATRGWNVTAIDVSTVALERAAEHADAGGTAIASRITWQQADVANWDPAPHRYDLISAQFMHLPRPMLTALHRRLAAAVRPGGTLLIVNHHPADLETTMQRPNIADMFATAEEMAHVLDPGQWSIETSAPKRQAVDPEGKTITISDTVLQAVRKVDA